MTGPKKLLDLASLGPMERLALEEARAMEPPPGLRDEVWKGLEAAVLPAAAAAAAAGVLSEGASAGSHAAVTAAGGKAAVGAATQLGLAVLPALKVVATAAIVLGSTAGVGFAVGRGWSVLAQRDAKDEPSVVEAHGPPAAPSAAASTAPDDRRFALASSATASPSGESLRADNAPYPRGADDPQSGPLPAPIDLARTNPREDANEAFHAPEPATPKDGARATAPAPARSTGSGATMAASPSPARFAAGAPSAGGAGAAAAASARPSTGEAIYGADPESLLANEAREALRAGDPRRSLALLQRMEGLGGAGVLAEERGLLEIEALVRLGDRDAAREHARAFLRVWPESVYAGRVEAMLRGL